VALYQSKQILNRIPVPTIDGAGEVNAIFAEYVVPAGGLAVNSVLEMFGVTPNMRVVDCIVHNTAAGTSATFDMGYLTGSYAAVTGTTRTCGAEFVAAGDLNATSLKRMVKSVTAEPVAAVGNLTDDTIGWGLKTTGATWAAGTVIRATLFTISL
jgi:hypothetical protein